MKVILLSVISVLFFSCENYKQKKEIKVRAINTSVKEGKQVVDSTSNLLLVSEKENRLFKPYVYNRNRKYDITIEKTFSPGLFSDSVVKTIKSMKFYRVDTIGAKFKIFGSVEHISISGYQKIQIDINNFPNLKTIKVFGSSLVFTNNSDFSKIEAFSFVKSDIQGVRLVSQFSNLKYLKIEYCKFYDLEVDFSSLKSLEELSVVAYMGEGEVNLRAIDVDVLPNLRRLRIIDDFGKIKGAPINISKRKWDYFYIYNRDVTLEEKIIIQEFNKKTS